MFDEAEELMVAAERMSSADRERIIEHLEAIQGKGFCVEDPAPSHAVMASQGFISVEEYLAFEDSSRIKHEYVAGRVYAMNGANQAHSCIAGNLFAAMRAHLRGGRVHRVLQHDLRTYIKVDDDEFYYYPDVVVACGRRDLSANAHRRREAHR